MRRIFPVLVLLIIATLLSLVARRRIWTEAGLEGVCKERTQAYFLAKRGMPADWKPIMRGAVSGGGMSIYGTWRVGEKYYVAMCSARFAEPVASIGYEIADSAGAKIETSSTGK